MIKGTFVEVELSALRELQRDAERYRFLCIDDNWGEDGGEDSWEQLGEASGAAFDEIVDSRMAKPQ